MKNKTMVRMISTGLVLTLVISLAACGSNSNTSETVASEAAEESSSAEMTDTSSGESTEENTSEVTTIKVATSGATAAYSVVDEDGNCSGYDVDVMEAVFERLPQYELEWVITDFDSILTGVTAGNYDIGTNDFSYTEARGESYYFSYAYCSTRAVFIQRADDDPLESLQDAADRGYTIESFASGNVTAAIEKWNEDNPESQIEIVYSETDNVVKLEHVVDGTYDFFIDDYPIYYSYTQEYGFDLQYTEMSDEDLERISGTADAYFLFAKDEDGYALREEINDVLKELKEDGTLLEISEANFGADQVPDSSKFEETVN